MPKLEDITGPAVARIIRALEAGTEGSWEPPWAILPGGLHQQAESRKPYQGANQLLLMMAALVEGHGDPRWATYRTWGNLEAQVRRGEHGTKLVKWGTWAQCPTHGKGNARCCPLVKSGVYASPFTVFNVAQVDNAPPMPDAPEQEWTDVERAERLIAANGVVVTHADPTRAFFMPTFPERINVPTRAAFDSAAGYYGTVLHEVTHWTGHESRLNREFGKVFGSETYAAEELVAELGAVFTAGAIGLPIEAHQDSAAYLGHWLTMLRAEPKRLYSAAKLAQTAATYLLDNSAESPPEGGSVVQFSTTRERGTHGRAARIRDWSNDHRSPRHDRCRATA